MGPKFALGIAPQFNKMIKVISFNIQPTIFNIIPPNEMITSSISPQENSFFNSTQRQKPSKACNTRKAAK